MLPGTEPEWHGLQGERYTLVYFAQPARSTLVQVGL